MNTDFSQPLLYRKRYIPQETVFLKNDRILSVTEDRIITSWKTLKPRQDFSYGKSCYYLKQGWKVSRFYDASGQYLYTYCDIIHTEYNADRNTYIFHDLLLDVTIGPDGFIKVLDLHEIPEALDAGLITEQMAKQAILLLDALLSHLYENGEQSLAGILDE